MLYYFIWMCGFLILSAGLFCSYVFSIPGMPSTAQKSLIMVNQCFAVLAIVSFMACISFAGRLLISVFNSI